VSEVLAELLGWFLLTPADLSPVNHYVVLADDTTDAAGSKGEHLEAH